MAKFKSKVVEIEAFQYTGQTMLTPGIPDWFYDACHSNAIWLHRDRAEIRTLEGNMVAQQGDWIIKGVKGEFYPCKPYIFAETYELVE